MPTYFTDAFMTEMIPTSLPASINTDEERATYIARGSAWADSAVGKQFSIGAGGVDGQKFPDITDDPATPEIIQELGATYGVAVLLRKAYADASIVTSLWQEWFDSADELATQIQDGTKDVTDSGGTEYGTRTRILTQIKSGAVPVFTTGQYDANGQLVSDNRGSLDSL